MKIIAIDYGGGASYHRLRLPLEYLQADFSNFLTKELVRNYDIVWLHMNCEIPVAELAIWKRELRFKLIVDYDDSWNVPRTHLDYNKILPTIQNSKDLCMLADHVIVSTEPLKVEKKEYNQNVTIIRNRIPYGKGQFQINNESFNSFNKRKLRVGFTGSIRSHFHDWNPILPQIRRISKMDCELIFIGSDQSKEWHQFDSIARLIPLQTRTDYIKAYNMIDIMLCPLSESHYNECKSELKALEAACSKSICVLSELYEQKSVICDYHVYCNGQYDDKVADLLKEDPIDLYDWKIDMSEGIISATDYEIQCVWPRQKICQLLEK